METFFEKLTNIDLMTTYYLKKPSSNWVFCGLTNIEIFIYAIEDTLIGSPILLPKYIKERKCIISLTHHYQPTYPYNDTKCFFRCVAIHHGYNINGLEKYTNNLIAKAESELKKSFKNGVFLSDIPKLEKCFDTSINIYSLKENDNAEVIYLSKQLFQTLYLNLYQNHFSYIKDFDVYAKRYSCNVCKRIFNRIGNMKTHQDTCTTQVKEIYSGGKCFLTKNIFERLAEESIYVKGSKYYPYISTFDFETLQKPTYSEIQGRKSYFEHIPASFSICSNIPYQTECIHRVSNGNTQELIDIMVKILLNQQQTSSSLMRQKYKSTIEKLEQKINETLENNPAGDGFEKKIKRYKSLLSSLLLYCDQLVIIGFNSQKYDLPLIKSYLISSLRRFDTLPQKIIKKDNAYMCISTKRLKFLDLVNYLAAGTSLDDLYKSYNVTTPKGVFPYEYFTSLRKLKKKKLPSRKRFYSTLTNKTISKKSYNECLEVWKKNKMDNFGQYLKLYNDTDVRGLLECALKMLKIEYQNGLDLFKESISLPGITQRYLFKNLKDDYFVGIGREHSHIYKDLRESGVVGGPSIIFHRRQIAGETLIKNREVCKKIIGYDANSLYLCCIAQDMPTGFYSLREKSNNYKKSTRYSNQALQWLTYLNHEKGKFIKHAENSIHGEVRIENFIVDGFEKNTNTVYEFYGCYFHGHNCNSKYNSKKWEKTLKRENDLKMLGYNVVSITSCQWQKHEASSIWYTFKEISCTYTDILTAIMQNKIFGIVKCDLHVPKKLISKFSEFPPIFKNTEITLADVGSHMRKYCRKVTRKVGVKKALISSMWGKGCIMLTPLLKKYVEMELIIDDIEFIMEYNPKKCFKWFQDKVVHDRRMADLDPNWRIRGETSKTKGNCAYGRTLMDKSKHTSTRFITGSNISNHVNNPLFKHMVELQDDIFEVTKKKKTCIYDLPIQIGIAVYSYAKLNLISFWEFINKFLVNDLYQLMECDTDSLYIAFARSSIDECVKPNLKKEWEIEKKRFFSSQDESLIEFEGKLIPKKQYEKRTPGLYKPEFIGTGMICLNSKVYHIFNDKEQKTSCKGIQQKRNNLTRENFNQILETWQSISFENAGFIRDGVKTKTYKQTKKGLTYFYAKRKVLSDGVSTTHLNI